MIRTGFPRAIGAIFLLVLVVLGGTRSAAAQGAGRSVAWQRFDVDLAIQLDGSVQVSETQAIQFTGTHQQGYRLVPLDHTTGVTDATPPTASFASMPRATSSSGARSTPIAMEPSKRAP
jgi:hypothetical protein